MHDVRFARCRTSVVARNGGEEIMTKGFYDVRLAPWLSASVLAVVLSASGAIAQSAFTVRKPEHTGSIVRHEPRPLIDAQSCPRWCSNDKNPCDPVAFKIVDDRCTGVPH
jgi:hypothetical protein